MLWKSVGISNFVWLIRYFSHRIHDTNQFSPVQSDTEFEVSTRPKGGDDCVIDVPNDSNKALMVHRPSWRWGELPSPIPKTDLQEMTGKSEPIKERDRKYICNFLWFYPSWNRKIVFFVLMLGNACYKKAPCTQNYRPSVDICML